jgi:uncharacterized membrane protein YccC
MRVGDLKKEMDARFQQVDVRFEQVDARFDRLERALATEHETTRRHMEILVEQCRADIRLALERMDGHERRLDDLLSSNARNHAAFIQWLQDHEVRLTALEIPGGSHSR